MFRAIYQTLLWEKYQEEQNEEVTAAPPQDGPGKDSENDLAPLADRPNALPYSVKQLRKDIIGNKEIQASIREEVSSMRDWES